MAYRAPVEDIRFVFDHIIDFAQIRATEKFSEASSDVVDAILNEAGKLCDEVIAPLQRAGDMTPAVLENGKVRSSPGFAEGYRAIADGGWVCLSAPEAHGGMGLPVVLQTAVNDMLSGACLALQLNPLLTQGQIEALEAHASDALKDLYLPKMISGEWSGTMNLTEPHAGSDVGALTSRAEPQADGTYAITGQKIFITWGDSDFVDNVCHLVLARLPDGVPGTKGISLFLVPRNLPDAEGKAGVGNALKVVSLEHKLGLHGSPTCVMQFDGATGWLVGEKHGGMAAMFTMMNNARLGVGAQGIGIAEAATQHAFDYAMERKQGKAGGTGTIIEHADVRRMVATMRSETFAARAIGLANATAIDMAKATGDAGWESRAALLTPICKAYGTDVGNEAAQMGVQVFGGMGFIEETGAAQLARDVRVTSIYEGTNGIQAMDLVARKMMDGGEAAFRLIEEIQSGAETARAPIPDLAAQVWQASENLRETTEWLVKQDMTDRFAGSVPFLRAFARVLGAHFHLKAALCDPAGGRARLARFYIKRLLPEHVALLAHVHEGASDLLAITPDDLAVV